MSNMQIIYKKQMLRLHNTVKFKLTEITQPLRSHTKAAPHIEYVGSGQRKTCHQNHNRIVCRFSAACQMQVGHISIACESPESQANDNTQ